MSPDDDRRSERGSSASGEEAFTEELKRIDAESEAVEVEFEALSEGDEGALDLRQDGDDDDEVEGLIWALPGLTRLALKSWLQAVEWGARTGVRVSLRIGHAAVDPRATVTLAREVSAGVRVYAREFLGISDLERRVEKTDPGGAAGGPTGVTRALASRDDGPPPSPEVSLRLRGAELLRQSADVRADDQAHPAYARIIGELAPDEGRILRLLATEGAQPVVDVRALNLIGVGSQLVAAELTMVGPEAGVRHSDRISEYMMNLQRLGLIEFSDKAISDPIRYQVLEAQPYVLESIKQASRAKTVHRSLRLTGFGQRFCDVVLPLDLEEVEDLTERS